MTDDPLDTQDPLDRPATRRLVLYLTAAGYLDPAARDAALRAIHPSRAWWLWTSRLLLALGGSLVLAGVVFFFAFNWDAIPPLGKLALVQALVAGCALAAWWTGLDSAGGQALLMAASTLVGVLLAVFGQVYQTGADAYGLFVGWAVLVAGWVAISRSAAHWILWIVVVDLAVGLYWGQVVEPRGLASWQVGAMALAVVNGLALAAREAGSTRFDWLGVAWPRWVLWASVVLFLTIPALDAIFGTSDRESLLALVLVTLVLVAGYWYFRYQARDLLSISIAALAACTIGLAVIGKAISDLEELAVLLFGAIVLIVSCAVTLWLRWLGGVMKRELSDE